MRFHRIGTACIVLLTAAAAGAQPAFTGNDFLARARADEPKAIAFLSGYASGWQGRESVAELQLDSVPGAKRLLSRNSVCFPSTVTAGQSLDVVLKYLEANPQSRHQPAGALIWVAFASAWPCPP